MILSETLNVKLNYIVYKGKLLILELWIKIKEWIDVWIDNQEVFFVTGGMVLKS